MEVIPIWIMKENFVLPMGYPLGMQLKDVRIGSRDSKIHTRG
jgi:hypothetical protein